MRCTVLRVTPLVHVRALPYNRSDLPYSYRLQNDVIVLPDPREGRLRRRRVRGEDRPRAESRR